MRQASIAGEYLWCLGSIFPCAQTTGPGHRTASNLNIRCRFTSSVSSLPLARQSKERPDYPLEAAATPSDGDERTITELPTLSNDEHRIYFVIYAPSRRARSKHSAPFWQLRTANDGHTHQV